MLGLSKDLGPFTDRVVTQLVAQLSDPTVGVSAADALGWLKNRPDIVVPALADSLQSTNAILRQSAAISLVRFEEKAVLALPALTNALNDPVSSVRQYIDDAILKINASVNKAKME